MTFFSVNQYVSGVITSRYVFRDVIALTTSTGNDMNNLVDTAIQLLRNGDPLPLDLEVALMGEGVDVAFLIHKYSI